VAKHSYLLSKKLSEKTGLPVTNMDYLFYRHVKDKSRVEVPEIEWQKDLSNVLASKDWIIEGTRPVKVIFDEADKIVVLNPTVFMSLFRQWKRYCLDPIQRKQHGFKNNLKLSRGIIKQYFEKEDLTKSEDPTYYRISKVKRILKDYSTKVIYLNSSDSVTRFFGSIEDPKSR